MSKDDKKKEHGPSEPPPTDLNETGTESAGTPPAGLRGVTASAAGGQPVHGLGSVSTTPGPRGALVARLGLTEPSDAELFRSADGRIRDLQEQLAKPRD